jgi:hypothetical protein
MKKKQDVVGKFMKDLGERTKATEVYWKTYQKKHF